MDSDFVIKGVRWPRVDWSRSVIHWECTTRKNISRNIFRCCRRRRRLATAIYDRRPRHHDRQLIRKSAHIIDSLFIIKMLYRDLLTFIVTFIVSFVTLFAVYFRCMYSRCDLL